MFDIVRTVSAAPWIAPVSSLLTCSLICPSNVGYNVDAIDNKMIDNIKCVEFLIDPKQTNEREWSNKPHLIVLIDPNNGIISLGNIEMDKPKKISANPLLLEDQPSLYWR